jgi:hypothetical protein
MECKSNPQLAKNALKNLTEIFKTQGEKSLMDFIEESDKHLDSMNENQMNELKEELGRFIQHMSKQKKSKSGSRKRKRSKGGGKNKSVGGSWQNPGSGPHRVPGSQDPSLFPGTHVPMVPAQMVPAPVPMVPAQMVPAPVPMVPAQMVPAPMGSPMGSPVPMVQPAQMPRGPQGPGLIRGVVRVGATFLLPRTNTGIIYSGLWLTIVLLASFAGQQHHNFLMMGVQQIMSGDCMGATGFFDAARHPLCTKWREFMIPMLTALNEVMKFNMRGLGVLSAGVAAVVTTPLLIDAIVYDLAFQIDYVITTAFQSFTGRPLVAPVRDPRRPSIPQLAGRMLSLINPGQMAALSVGQQPDMTQQLATPYFIPAQGQPFYGQPMYPYNQGYGQQAYAGQVFGHMPQPLYPQMMQPMTQPMMSQPMMQPMMSPPMMQPMMQPQWVQQMPPMTQPLQPQWDPRQAQEMPAHMQAQWTPAPPRRSRSPESNGSSNANRTARRRRVAAANRTRSNNNGPSRSNRSNRSNNRG